jgi:hypothetical protein
MRIHIESLGILEDINVNKDDDEALAKNIAQIP